MAGSIGIGMHSFDLLLDIWGQHYSQAAQSLSDTVASAVTTTSDNPSQKQNVLDPNAAWFALASVAIKEWLYRISKYISASIVAEYRPFNVYMMCLPLFYMIISSQSGSK